MVNFNNHFRMVSKPTPLLVHSPENYLGCFSPVMSVFVALDTQCLCTYIVSLSLSLTHTHTCVSGRVCVYMEVQVHVCVMLVSWLVIKN